MNFDSEIQLLEAMRERFKNYPEWHYITQDINWLLSDMMRLKELADLEEAEREKDHRAEQDYAHTAGHHI